MPRIRDQGEVAKTMVARTIRGTEPIAIAMWIATLVRLLVAVIARCLGSAQRGRVEQRSLCARRAHPAGAGIAPVRLDGMTISWWRKPSEGPPGGFGGVRRGAAASAVRLLAPGNLLLVLPVCAPSA